ncbi:MAG TPA: hypothetical protein VFU21_18190 [Kofleriaceae bacterium]|nr:hypothetical protein [Kofleriaceae bacterium]
MAKPLEGTIVAYTISDGVGRIELDDGEELRFSLRAMKGVVPAVGVRVKVGATEPYPLGGRRALDITLADEAGYQKLKKQYEKAHGEAMRRDLGRRADEFQMPVTALKKALAQPAESVPPVSTPSRPRGHSLRRAPTPPPMPRGSRAGTARPKAPNRASTSRPVRAPAKTVKTVKRKSTRGDTR